MENNSQQTGGGAAGGQQDSNFAHQVAHPGVTCDGCATQICGFRYKCMTCPNFDLCCQCERRGMHAGHPMVRIAFPEQAAEATSGLSRGCPAAAAASAQPRKCGLSNSAQQHQGQPPLLGLLDELVRGFVNPDGLKGQSSTGQKTEGANNNGTEKQPAEFDFVAAAAQAQEFFKALGIPIDLTGASAMGQQQPQAEAGTSKKDDAAADQTAGAEQTGFDPRWAMVLNQLLSMGFQNQAQLTQLIQSMNGDLNSILAALVP